jgi:hypothetical protein
MRFFFGNQDPHLFSLYKLNGYHVSPDVTSFMKHPLDVDSRDLDELSIRSSRLIGKIN